MERVISDALVQDPLAPESAPHYDLDEPMSYYFIDSTRLIECIKTIDIDGKNRVPLPLLMIDGEWKASWRNQPSAMKSLLEDLFVTAARSAPITIKMDAPIKDIIAYADKVIYGILGSPEGMKLGTHILLCSRKFRMDNGVQLYDAGFDRHTVVIPNLADNKLIALPDPEFLGAMPLRSDDNNYYKSFGAFVLPNNIINIEIP